MLLGPIASLLINASPTSPLATRLFPIPQIDEGTVESNDKNELTNENIDSTIGSILAREVRALLSINLESNKNSSNNQTLNNLFDNEQNSNNMLAVNSANHREEHQGMI